LTFALDAKQAAQHLDELPDLYREVLVLRFIDGLGPKEIGELVEQSENVVSVRIHRGLRLLKERIKAAEDALKKNRPPETYLHP
jgi:RNA polymerase sigma factor (sigma-70 family)